MNIDITGLIGFVIMIVSLAFGYGKLNQTVKQLKEDQAEIKKDVSQIKSKLFQ